MMIKRMLNQAITKRLGSGKAILLMGARRTGKTTLLREFFQEPLYSADPKQNGGEGSLQDALLWLNGDEYDVRALFENVSSTRLKHIFGTKRFVVLDEAQRIKDIGLKLKLITDTMPDLQIIATGSSSFELASRVTETLTGRKWEYTLYPFSFAEMVNHHGLLEEKRLIPHRLVYGYYPEAVTHPGDEKEILKELSESYLYKDILMWEGIKKPERLVKLLQALALQIGSQVSYSELGQLCGLDVKTVEKYILLLEQCFVIFRLGSFSRNLRNELKFSKKIYFYDNGIRNGIIANFSILENRQDAGALWENFLIAERKKKLEYEQIWRNTWFWRTVGQQEIDYIEEGDGVLRAFEFKLNPAAKYKKPKVFLEAYPQCVFELITPDKIEQFLLPPV
jgi:predicted AAA+ superfamily ATPase